MLEQTRAPVFAVEIGSGVEPKVALENWLYEETGGVVQSGPFKDMKLLRETSWPNGSLCPVLLGCHEQELWTALEEEIARMGGVDRPLVLNVGCAEGYYAVGLKRRLPHARVWATDIDPNALRITMATAVLNEVELTIQADPRAALTEGPDLIVMDCEGAETAYLDPDMFPALLRSRIILEVHQSEEQDTAGIIFSHWAKSHSIWLLWEGGRNPNDYDLIKEHTSFLRWMAVNENRPCQMAWFVMRPK